MLHSIAKKGKLLAEISLFLKGAQNSGASLKSPED